MAWSVTPSSVGVIGTDEPELEQLPLFLTERGFGARRWSTLVGPPRLVGVKDALVLFADGFEVPAIAAWSREVQKASPDRLVIVVTALASGFAGPTALKGKNVLLLVRPVLAWHLVDVIRNHVQKHVAGEA